VGLRELIAADARLLVADRFVGHVVDSPYFGNWERVPVSWRMTVGEVDGEAAVIVQRVAGEGWTPKAAVRLHVVDGRIVGITDYLHCPWVLSVASTVRVDEPA
jgi:RNA polymerase sigma-70 factor (ECF subfamily)